MRTVRFFSRGTTLFLAGVAGWAISCSNDEAVRGQLMLAISADLSIPENMNEVEIQILSETGERINPSFPLMPEPLGKPMPGTLAILPPDLGGQRIRVRLIGVRDDGVERRVRVVRESVVVIPRDRIASLTMPLRWLCEGEVEETAEGPRSSCGEDETCVAGRCVSAVVDSDGLPTYDPSAPLGQAPGEGTGAGDDCIEVEECFNRGIGVTPGPGCTIAAPSGADEDRLNVAMVLPYEDGADGHCDEDRGICYVPMDRHDEEGWVLDGNTITLPEAVCRRLGDGRISGVQLTTACPVKHVNTPLCGPWTQAQPAAIGEALDAGGGDGGGGNVDRPPDAGPDAAEGSGGSGDTEGGTVCFGEVFQAEPKTTALHLMVDASLQAEPFWSDVLDGIVTTLSDPSWAGVTVALSTFQGPGECPPAVRGVPDVAFAPLPGNATPIATRLASVTPAGSAPLESGVAEAIQTAIDYSSQTGELTAAVLLSSGAADDCATDLPTLTSHAGQGPSASPPVPLHVIGFGSPSALLTEIALAGGTTAQVSDGGGATHISLALDAIRAQSAAQCLYSLPEGAVEGGEPFTVSIESADDGGPIERVESLSSCTDLGGYAVTGPDVFALCPTTCAGVTPDTVVNVSFGCGGSTGGGGSSGVGGSANMGGGTSGGGGSTGLGGSAGSGQGGASPDPCSDTGDPCNECVCVSCGSLDNDCLNAIGCGDVFICLADNVCTSVEECYSPEFCGPVIDANGGPSGVAAQTAEELLQCVLSSCVDQCAGP